MIRTIPVVLLSLLSAGVLTFCAPQPAAATEWYSRVVVAHANKALSTDNPAQYVRDLHKACLLETA